jgi:hypothetical protein
VKKTRAFIINLNRLTLPRKMADYLADVEGVEPIIVDNNSNYPPLLEYYEHCPHKVERLTNNYGNTVLWRAGILEKYEETERFIITDPDLILDDIPKDWLHLLNLGLDKYAFATKAGFSLEINNLPNTPMKKLILEWETSAWVHKLDNNFFNANIDTTFALWRRVFQDFPAVRTNRPYTARHASWYYTKLEDIPPDELYYMRMVGNINNYWTCRIKEQLGA